LKLLPGFRTYFHGAAQRERDFQKGSLCGGTASSIGGMIGWDND
jgi:hypothetical protein